MPNLWTLAKCAAMHTLPQLPMDLRTNLTRLMGEQGHSASSLTKRARLGGTAVWDILSGKSKNPRIDTLEAISRALGVSLIDLLVGDIAQPQGVAIIGSADGENDWILGVAENQAVALRTEGGEAVAIRVRSDAMSPVYRSGDTLIGVKSVGQHLDNMIGLDCIIVTDDGRRYVKMLQRGTVRGRFTLRSFSPREPDIENVKIRWAAPIQWIRRGSR